MARYRCAPDSSDLLAIDHPGGLHEHFTHDAWSRVVCYQYGTNEGNAGLRGGTETPEPPSLLAQHYRYDPAGRLVQLHNENASVHRFAYDVRDRLVQESGFDGHAIAYRWSEAPQSPFQARLQ